MRVLTLAAFVLAAAVALAGAGAAHAATAPESQGAICARALDKMTAGSEYPEGVYRVGRLHPALLGGVSQRPDEFALERHRRVALLDSALGIGARDCPDFAPFAGILHGHMLASPQDADWRNR